MRTQKSIAFRQHSRHTKEILACNLGSGSIKLLRGDKHVLTLEGKSEELACKYADFLKNENRCSIVLHRVVHGGDVLNQPYIVDDNVVQRIKHWSTLAPLHNKAALRLIKITEDTWPNAKQFVIFDNALYHELPVEASSYALPSNLSPSWPIRKYGFHGIAHSAQFRILSHINNYPRLITIHIGGGASLTAWKNGKVIDTTMGFSPTDGVPMTTRSGTLDPMIILHLLMHENYAPAQLKDLLNKHSGLKGVSGISGDYRDIQQIHTHEAKLARNIFSRHLTKSIGSMLALLGGVDAISFSGGLVENQPEVRAACLEPLHDLGVKLSRSKNQEAAGLSTFHSNGSKTHIWLNPADECEEMMRMYEQYKYHKEAS